MEATEFLEEASESLPESLISYELVDWAENFPKVIFGLPLRLLAFEDVLMLELSKLLVCSSITSSYSFFSGSSPISLRVDLTASLVCYLKLSVSRLFKSCFFSNSEGSLK